MYILVYKEFVVGGKLQKLLKSVTKEEMSSGTRLKSNVWPGRAIYSHSEQEIRLVTLNLKAHTRYSDQQVPWWKSHHPVPSGHVRGSPSNTYKQQCLCVPVCVKMGGSAA